MKKKPRSSLATFMLSGGSPWPVVEQTNTRFSEIRLACLVTENNIHAKHVLNLLTAHLLWCNPLTSDMDLEVHMLVLQKSTDVSKRERQSGK